MLQFPVPQFIDIEDKLIGPFSLKQFLFLLPGGLLILLLFKTFAISFLFFLLAIPVLLATIIVAFGRFNGRPIYLQMNIFMKYIRAPKRLVFHKDAGPLDDLNISIVSAAPAKSEQSSVQTAAESPQSRLKKLAMSLEQKNEEEYNIVKPESKVK